MPISWRTTEKSVIKGRCHLLRQKNLPFKFVKIPLPLDIRNPLIMTKKCLPRELLNEIDPVLLDEISEINKKQA